MSFPATTTFVPPPTVGGIETNSSISTQGFDLATLVLLVSLKRHEQLEGSVVGQMNDIQGKNAVLAKYRDILNKLKNISLEDKKGKTKEISQELYESLQKFRSENPELWGMADGKDAFLEMGHHLRFGKEVYYIRALTDGGKEKVTNNLQTAVEKLSGNSQVEMIKLQASMTKANQMMDFASTFVHKADDVMRGIIRNIS